jgi:hypothetical protein
MRIVFPGIVLLWVVSFGCAGGAQTRPMNPEDMGKTIADLGQQGRIADLGEFLAENMYDVEAGRPYSDEEKEIIVNIFDQLEDSLDLDEYEREKWFFEKVEQDSEDEAVIEVHADDTTIAILINEGELDLLIEYLEFVAQRVDGRWWITDIE